MASFFPSTNLVSAPLAALTSLVAAGGDDGGDGVDPVEGCGMRGAGQGGSPGSLSACNACSPQTATPTATPFCSPARGSLATTPHSTPRGSPTTRKSPRFSPFKAVAAGLRGTVKIHTLPVLTLPRPLPTSARRPVTNRYAAAISARIGEAAAQAPDSVELRLMHSACLLRLGLPKAALDGCEEVANMHACCYGGGRSSLASRPVAAGGSDLGGGGANGAAGGRCRHTLVRLVNASLGRLDARSLAELALLRSPAPGASRRWSASGSTGRGCCSDQASGAAKLGSHSTPAGAAVAAGAAPPSFSRVPWSSEAGGRGKGGQPAPGSALGPAGKLPLQV